MHGTRTLKRIWSLVFSSWLRRNYDTIYDQPSNTVFVDKWQMPFNITELFQYHWQAHLMKNFIVNMVCVFLQTHTSPSDIQSPGNAVFQLRVLDSRNTYEMLKSHLVIWKFKRIFKHIVDLFYKHIVDLFYKHIVDLFYQCDRTVTSKTSFNKPIINNLTK